MTEQNRVCVVGLGFAGLTLGITFAEVGCLVDGVDHRQEVIVSLAQGRAHFFERGLDEALRRELGRRFFCHERVPDSGAATYIIAVGTPLNGREPHMEDLLAATREVGSRLKPGSLVVLRSTVPVRTTRMVVLPLLEQASGLRAGTDFHLAFAPERTVEGRALHELRALPQIIGGLTPACVSRCADLFRIFSPQIIAVESLEAAELIKAVNNSYRDSTFALANEIALLCQAWNIDAHELIRAANSGYPRSQIPQPSPGVGGYCLSKDPHLLIYAARQSGVEPRLTLAAREINEAMPAHVVGVVERFFTAHGKALTGSKVYLLGLAFKGRPETSDVRFSPSLEVARLLRDKGCLVHGYDPHITPEITAREGIQHALPEHGFTDADAVVLMNNNPQFETLPVREHLMRTARPALFFDTWRLHAPESLHDLPHVKYATLGHQTF